MDFILFLGFILLIGIGFGIISSTPLGPINLLVAENYLSDKKVKIIPFLSGVILIDSIFGYLTFWGFEEFLSDYELIGASIGILGGIAIIAIGIIGIYQQIKGKHNPKKKIEIKKNIFLKSSTASFSKGFILCGSNPGFIAFWGWVAYNAKNWTSQTFPQFEINFFNLILFPIGIIFGDFLWFGLFTYLLKKGARRYSGSIIDKIRTFISWGLIALGLFTVYASLNYEDKILVKINSEKLNQTGYINLDGDTIIPFSKYQYCYSDTIKDFGIVKNQEGKIVAIDIKQRILFEVYDFENGPDPISEDLFRIKKNNKIGFANTLGEIVIQPQYLHALPFDKGKAKVSKSYASPNQDKLNKAHFKDYFFINKRGNIVKEK